jgi:N-acetyl-gamma-glutamyl-phosphate reductase
MNNFNTQNKIKAGVIGGAGYTGGELIRLLLNHPYAEISFVHSKSNSGKNLYEVHHDLAGETELRFTSDISEDADVIFLCLGHGESSVFLAENKLPENSKIIDLSQDFRLKEKNENNSFVYGLPELCKAEITKAKNIANPGCFATCIQLGLLPLAAKNLLNDHIHISGITGSTGAGRSLTETSHFSWRNNNISTYKVFEHQHLLEINQNLKQLQNGFDHKIHFVPYRGNFSRGIITTSYTETDVNLEDAIALYEEYYKDHPFVHVSKTNPHLKQVVNTNKCLLHLQKHGENLVIVSAIDNLLKGASGQAVQNMNLAFGIEETAGLKLKAMAF